MAINETNVIQLGACDSTTLTDNGNCTFTFDTGGGIVTFSANSVVGVDFTPATQTLSLELCDGTSLTQVIDDCVDIVDNIDGTFTATYTNGDVVSWDTNDVVTTLINNNDGTYTYTNEAGATTLITSGAAIPRYGEIYTHDGVGTQTPGITYAVLTQWTNDGLSSAGVTPTQAANKIAIDNTALGIYKVSMSLAYSGTGNSNWVCAVFFNGVEQPAVEFSRKLGVGGDVGSGSAIGFIDVDVPGDIDVRVRSDDGADTFVLLSGSLVVEWVAAT